MKVGFGKNKKWPLFNSDQFQRFAQ